MYFPIMSVLATFLKEKGLFRVEDAELRTCLVKVVDSHSLTTMSCTKLRGSGAAALEQKIMYYIIYNSVAIVLQTHI